MQQKKIGIIREAKFPPDSRVPLIPSQIRYLLDKYKNITIFIQPSKHRCYADHEFEEAGIVIQENLRDCDILLGVKEEPYDLLIPGKKYLFFSHTIKKQPQNKKLLQALLAKKITMVDYECLKGDNGERVIAFGRWAGIIGTHNAFWTWGQRTGEPLVKRAKDCKDYDELKMQYKGLKIPNVKIVLTGTGRVAKGALEFLQEIKVKQVTKEEFLQNAFGEAVFVNLDSDDLYDRKSDGKYLQEDYYSHPENYKCVFTIYAEKSDVLINAIYWNPKAPQLFSKEDMRNPAFSIKVIADVSCDVNGGVPATIRSTTINEPVFGYDVNIEGEIAPYIPESIDIMAIDNLPNELPRNASEEFGNLMINFVWEELLKEESRMINDATICKDGKLNEPFLYLSDYAQ
ncbi:MAG: alanine dehydrogenase [Chitinophagales bacterium]|nr:alanine dehydrogenase [Chitinophagales bacterium]